MRSCVYAVGGSIRKVETRWARRCFMHWGREHEMVRARWHLSEGCGRGHGQSVHQLWSCSTQAEDIMLSSKLLREVLPRVGNDYSSDRVCTEGSDASCLHYQLLGGRLFLSCCLTKWWNPTVHVPYKPNFHFAFYKQTYMKVLFLLAPAAGLPLAPFPFTLTTPWKPCILGKTISGHHLKIAPQSKASLVPFQRRILRPEENLLTAS